MFATMPTGVLYRCTTSWRSVLVYDTKPPSIMLERAWCSCRCVEEVIRGVISQACEVMIASHNQACRTARHSLLHVRNCAGARYRVTCRQLL